MTENENNEHKKPKGVIAKVKDFFQSVREKTEMREEFQKRLTKSIILAQDDERERTEARLYAQFEQDTATLTSEYSFIVAEKDAIIHQLNKSIENLNDQLTNAKKAYLNYYQESVAMKRLSAEMLHQTERLFDKTGETYQAYVRIRDNVFVHYDTMLKTDAVNRNLLTLTPSGLQDMPEETKSEISSAMSASTQKFLEMREQLLKDRLSKNNKEPEKDKDDKEEKAK